MAGRRLVTSLAVAAAVLASCNGGADPGVDTAAVTTTTAAATASPTSTSAPAATTSTALPVVSLAGTDAKVVLSPKGVVVTVAGPAPGGVRVQTPCGNSALLTQGVPVKDIGIVFDPGHGGDEKGALAESGLTEKEVNLAVTAEARAALTRAGITSATTRSGDYRMTLAARGAVVTALKPKAFVSIHHNAVSDGPRDGPGSEVFYQVASAESKRLAGLIYEEVVRALSAYDVAWSADTDAGAKYRRSSSGDDYYGILRRTQIVPGVLAELAYMDNPAEAELLARPDVQRVEGEAVARGIIRFLTTKDPGSGFTEPYPRNEPAGPGGGSGGCVDPAL